MKPLFTNNKVNFFLAICVPFLAWVIQWGLWVYINPFVWFLFYPAVFFSARLGGLIAGIVSTILSAVIVWFFFLQPQYSFSLEHTNNLFSIIVFGLMGYLMSDVQDRLRKANKRLFHALNNTPKDDEKDNQLNEELLKNKKSAIPFLEKKESGAGSQYNETKTFPLILIVDDHEDITEYIAQNLSNEFLVSTAANGKEGLEKAKVIKPDLIITDIMMPIMNGEEMVVKLHEIPELADTPIIILTAVIDEQLKFNLLKESVQDFINKPFSINELKYKVENLVKQTKKHKKHLSEAEQRYKNALDNMLEGCQILSKEWEYLYINPAAEKHNKRSNSELIGKKYMDVWPGIEETHIFKVIEDCLTNKKNHYLENEFFFPDGSPGWFELSVYSVPEGVFILSVDITIRKNSEEKIKKSESELKRAHKIAIIGYWIWYINENKLEWSDEMYPIFGIDKNTFNGKLDEVISNAIHPDDREKVQKSNRSVMESGNAIPTEYRVIWPDKSIHYIWAEAGELIRDNNNNPIVLKGIVQDITQRKLTEIALHKNHQKLSLAMSVANMSWWEMNIKTGEVVFDKHKAEMLGYPPEMFHHYTDFTALLHPDDYEKAMVAMKDHINGTKDKYEVEYRILTQSGIYKWFYDIGSIEKNELTGETLTVTGLVFDISDRKQAELELQNSKAILDTALDSMTDAIFISDNEGKFLKFNEAFATFHKFRNKQECATSLIEYPEFVDVFLPNGELAPLEKWAVPRALRGETATNAEYRLKRKDTGEAWTGSYSFAPIRNVNGAIEGSVVVARDITERKIAEEKLNESENRFRKTFEEAPLGMVLTNSNFQFVSANAKFCDMMGFTLEEITSKTFVDITHPDYIEENVANIKKLISGEIKVYKTEKRFIRKDKSTIWCSLTVTFQHTSDRKFIYLIGMVEDISVRKQAEEQIRKLGQHYQALIEKAPDGILLLNAEGNIKYASPSARKLFGYSLTEEISANGAEFTHPDDLPMVLSELEKLFRDPSYIPTLQYRFMDKDKNWRWVESTFTNMLHDSSVESIIINFRDITTRRNDEEKLRESEITFASMFQKSPVTIILSIPFEGTILDVNESFLRNMEYSRDEVIGSTPIELGLFDNPIEREKLVAFLKENNSVFAYECRFRTKSGKTMVGLLSIVFIKIFGRACQLSTIIDITDRKKTEQALIENEEIFRHFMENSPIYVFFKDENIRAVRLSNNYEYLLDRPLNEILGKTMDELFPSELAKSMIAADKRILNNQELVIVDEELNGRFYTTIKFPIIIDGKARYLAGYTIDITERKLAENKIKAQLEELQHWYDATLEREERILEIKYEVNELLVQLGKPIRYASANQDDLLPGQSKKTD